MLDLRSVLNKFVPDEGDYTPAIVVAEAITWLDDNDPEGLAEWLWEHRHAILNERFGSSLRAARAATFRRARARAFGAASSVFAESGDVEPLSHFTVPYKIAGDGTQRRVGEMVGADHRFVADGYEASGKYDLLLAAFHRAVAKKCGRKPTADVMDEGTYERLYVSIVGGKPE